MEQLVRFSVSMNRKLLEKFDTLVAEQGYSNRSEAVRDAIRKQMIRREWEEGDQVAGVITLLYDHHQPGLSQQLIELQHHTLSNTISTTHVHLDGSNCLEFIAVRGDARAIEALANHLTSLKGVKHGGLSATSTGKKIT